MSGVVVDSFYGRVRRVCTLIGRAFVCLTDCVFVCRFRDTRGGGGPMT